MTRGGTVIVGAGHGGFATATALRDAGIDGPVTLIDQHDGLPYQRPPLSKDYLLGKVDPNRVAFRPATYYDRREITLLLGRTVVDVDPAARTVRLASGEALGYDRLVFATGARARALLVPGHHLANVVSLRTIADSDSLRSILASARRPVVIGGGFIGLEFAAVAAAGGTTVTIIEEASRLLSRSVSAPTASRIENAHRSYGNSIVTQTRVRRIVGNAAGRVSGVELADGAVTAADLVVIGVGAVPNTELAESAGLAVNDGVLVDEYLRTSNCHIFAVGDCARVTNDNGWTWRRESVQNATDQARTVAKTISGAPTAYTASPWFWSDQHKLKLQIAGDLAGHDEAISTSDEAGAREFSTYCFRAGRLVAVESVNRHMDHVAARKLLQQTDHTLGPGDIRAGFGLGNYLKPQ